MVASIPRGHSWLMMTSGQDPSVGYQYRMSSDAMPASLVLSDTMCKTQFGSRPLYNGTSSALH